MHGVYSFFLQSLKKKLMDIHSLIWKFVSIRLFRQPLVFSFLSVTKKISEEKNLDPKKTIRGGVKSVIGDGDVKSDIFQKLTYIDAYKFYGGAVLQFLLFQNLSFEIKLEFRVLIIEVDLKHPDEFEDKIFSSVAPWKYWLLFTISAISIFPRNFLSKGKYSFQ